MFLFKKNSILFCIINFFSTFVLCRDYNLIINQLKFTIMQKFIISVKTKHGQDVIPPYIVNDLTAFGHYSERITANGLVVLVDSLSEEDTFVELPKPQDNGK
nr:MAG: hypothetical protein [Microvirus sp.]